MTQPIPLYVTPSLAGGVGGALNPSVDNTFGIGTSSLRWTSVNISGCYNVWGAAGDANPQTALCAQKLSFGAGGMSALDTRTIRTAANTLTLDDGAGGTTGVTLNIGGTTTTQTTLTSTAYTIGRLAGAWTLSQVAHTTDTLPSNMTFSPQAAFAAATGLNRVSASFVVNVSPPTNGATAEAGFQVQRNNVLFAQIGADPGATAFGALWLGGNITINNGNMAFLSDGSTVSFFNTPTGAKGVLSVNTVGTAAWDVNSVTLFNGSTMVNGGGTGVLSVANAGVIPTSNFAAAGGGILYAQAGAGKWRGGNGTITTFGPAEPHCPVCGTDFAHEWESDQYGYLAICVNCLADELGSRPWIRRQKS